MKIITDKSLRLNQINMAEFLHQKNRCESTVRLYGNLIFLFHFNPISEFRRTINIFITRTNRVLNVMYQTPEVY